MRTIFLADPRTRDKLLLYGTDHARTWLVVVHACEGVAVGAPNPHVSRNEAWIGYRLHVDGWSHNALVSFLF